MYEHFLCLSATIRILIDEEHCLKLNDYAHKLLYFVKHCSGLYASEHVTYNVHNLVYLCDDIKRFGSFDRFNTFKFENFMYQLNLVQKALQLKMPVPLIL